jgi:hypothetical protein
MSSALRVLAYQGLYAKFEELAYAIPYDEISKESLDKAVKDAADFFGFNTNVINGVDKVFIPHIFIYPFYVQSYCTSIIPALEIYFMEGEKEGSGLDAYKKMIDSTEGELDFLGKVVHRLYLFGDFTRQKNGRFAVGQAFAVDAVGGLLRTRLFEDGIDEFDVVLVFFGVADGVEDFLVVDEFFRFQRFGIVDCHDMSFLMGQTKLPREMMNC